MSSFFIIILNKMKVNGKVLLGIIYILITFIAAASL